MEIAPAPPSPKKKRKRDEDETEPVEAVSNGHWHIGRMYRAKCKLPSRCLGVRPAEAINWREKERGLPMPKDLSQYGC